jgi:hypothetical protein
MGKLGGKLLRIGVALAASDSPRRNNLTEGASGVVTLSLPPVRGIEACPYRGIFPFLIGGRKDQA